MLRGMLPAIYFGLTAHTVPPEFQREFVMILKGWFLPEDGTVIVQEVGANDESEKEV